MFFYVAYDMISSSPRYTLCHYFLFSPFLLLLQNSVTIEFQKIILFFPFLDFRISIPPGSFNIIIKGACIFFFGVLSLREKKNILQKFYLVQQSINVKIYLSFFFGIWLNLIFFLLSFFKCFFFVRLDMYC